MSTTTLHLGDCRDWLKTIEPGSVDCVIADPPYGARRPSARRTADERFDEIQGNDEVDAWWLFDANDALKDGGAIYLFTCWDKLQEWKASMSAAGFRVRSCIVWDKVVHGMADLETCWAPQHEMILFGAKGRHELCGKRPFDVIHCQRLDPAVMVHPYQKPEKLMAPLVRASTRRGDTVLDPFAGSGAVALACQSLGRNYLGCEIDPAYHAIAQKRIADEQAKMVLFAGIES